jgi:glucose/arabinose dehydrogenase
MVGIRLMRWALATVATMLAVPCLAQDDDNLPTLKLDRIASQPAFSGQTRAARAETSSFTVEVISSQLSAPWALAFLPDGRMLVNENTGKMKVLSVAGESSGSVQGLPEFSHEGWAGLFDVAVDPQFSTNGLVYFSYVASSDDAEAKNIPRVARGVLDSRTLQLSAIEVLVDGFWRSGAAFRTGWHLTRLRFQRRARCRCTGPVDRFGQVVAPQSRRVNTCG